MNWETLFSEAYPEPGATHEDLARLESTLFAPLSAAELQDAQLQASRNPFSVTDRLHATYRPLDPTNWRFPTAKLPESYLDFLRFSNGGVFRNGDRWFQFFPALDPKNGLRAMLLAYELPQYMPLALPFASNGGGVFYLFDLRGEPDDGEYPIVASHAGSLGWDSDDHWFVAGAFLEACAGTVSVDIL